MSPDEEHRVFELVVQQRLSHRQVAKMTENAQQWSKSVSHTTVRRIVQEKLKAIAVEERGMVEAYRHEQSRHLDHLIRTSQAIAMGSKCSVCAGEKTIKKDKLDPDSDLQVCPKCEGSGRNESDSVRLQAVNTVRGLLERRAKLFGLDAPAQVDVEVGGGLVVADIRQMGSQELATNIADMFRPVADTKTSEVGPATRALLPKADDVDGDLLLDDGESVPAAGDGSGSAGTALGA